jgi:ABC-type nitrate/sulfonate/bicarbonate transport system substrate-binding protein
MPRFARVTTTLTIAVMMTLCSLAVPVPSRAQALAKLRVAMIPIEPAADVYYAKENGFFAKAGLDVDVTQSASTPALASAVLSGTYDISYATVPTLATAHSKGLPFVMIAPGIADSPQHFGGAIMVAENSTLKTGKDFNGKTLGTAGLNTIAEYLPRAWIDKTGGDSSTVKFVEMPFPVTAEAIASGRVDAAYLAEPFVTIAEKKHLARILTTGDDSVSAGQYVATGWFTTVQWAKAHPDLVARFQRAIAEAGAWANANPAKVVPILAKDLKADPALVAQARRPYHPERLIAAEVQPYIDITAKYAKFPTFKAEELIYTPAK